MYETMFNFLFRCSASVKSALISCALASCLAVSIYSSITTHRNVSQVYAIQKEPIHDYALSSGIISLVKLQKEIHCLKYMKFLFQQNVQ
jgi:hypothetical protein